LSKLRMYLKCI